MVSAASRNESHYSQRNNGKKRLENEANQNYTFMMVVQSIREFNRAVPFKPYEIRMASGVRYVVPHSDFATVSPKGSFVIVFDRNERPHHLSALLIECAAPLNGNHGRKTSRRSSH
jgi:hypothetical protein